jgi:hypothetical protein
MKLEVTTPSGPPDKRFLIVVLVFGIAGTCASGRWLQTGSIEIRGGGTRVGVGGGGLPRPNPQHRGPVAGRIEANNDWQFYPLCLAWIGLGVSMIVLGTLAWMTSNVSLLKLSAWSCAVVLLLGATTVGTALWLGP